MRVLAAWIAERDRIPDRVAAGRPRRWIALVAGMFGLAAAYPARAHAAPVALPRELLASIAIGPEATLKNLVAYADAVKPGVGAALTPQIVRSGLASAVGASSLDGLDPASWTYVLVGTVDAAPAVALAGKVSDAKALEASAGTAHVVSRGGWAVVGPRPLVERVAAHALATLPAQRVPTSLTATVYMSHVVERYKAQIEGIRSTAVAAMAIPGNAGQLGKVMESYVEGALSLIYDTDKLVVTLEVSPDLASLDIAMVPRASSRLAKFVALQRPTNFALLDRLPDTPATILFAGHFEMGPYRGAMLELMASMYGPAESKDLIAAMELVRKVMTGDLAMAMRFTPGAAIEFAQVFAVTDAAAADRAMGAIFEQFKNGRTFESMGVSTTIKTDPRTTLHHGVALRSYDTTYDLSKAPAGQRQLMEAVMSRGPRRVHVGTFDRLAMIVAGKDGLADVERTVDAARGKAPHFTAPPIVGQMLASSRARKDSMAMMMDIGSFMAAIQAVAGSTAPAPASVQPIVISLGCADRSAHIRVGVPVTTARTAVRGANP